MRPTIGASVSLIAPHVCDWKKSPPSAFVKDSAAEKRNAGACKESRSAKKNRCKQVFRPQSRELCKRSQGKIIAPGESASSCYRCMQPILIDCARLRCAYVQFVYKREMQRLSAQPDMLYSSLQLIAGNKDDCWKLFSCGRYYQFQTRNRTVIIITFFV